MPTRREARATLCGVIAATGLPHTAEALDPLLRGLLPALAPSGSRALCAAQPKVGQVRLPRWVFVRGAWMFDLEISVTPDAPARWAELAGPIAASLALALPGGTPP